MKLNTIGYFEIQSSNPEREMQFYHRVFGWKFTKDEANPLEYFRIETDGIDGGLLKRSTAVPPSEWGTNAFVCSVQVEKFDDTRKKILALGGKVRLPKFAVTGRCWQGYYADGDNNTFGIFQVDLNAK